MSEPEGWYGNPDGTETQRYWDGAQWTHEVRPLPAATGFDPSRTEASGPGPAPLVGAPDTAPGSGAPGVAPVSGADSGSVSDLFGVLFDFGVARSISPALARTGYRVGAIITLVVSALALVVGLQGGGLGAVASVIAFPLLALLWLIILRVLSQILVDRSSSSDAAEAG